MRRQTRSTNHIEFVGVSPDKSTAYTVRLIRTGQGETCRPDSILEDITKIASARIRGSTARYSSFRAIEPRAVEATNSCPCVRFQARLRLPVPITGNKRRLGLLHLTGSLARSCSMNLLPRRRTGRHPNGCLLATYLTDHRRSKSVETFCHGTVAQG